LKNPPSAEDERGEIVWNAIFLDFARNPKAATLMTTNSGGPNQQFKTGQRSDRGLTNGSWQCRRLGRMASTWWVARILNGVLIHGFWQ
jgi:hypothetical protein